MAAILKFQLWTLPCLGISYRHRTWYDCRKPRQEALRWMPKSVSGKIQDGRRPPYWKSMKILWNFIILPNINHLHKIWCVKAFCIY